MTRQEALVNMMVMSLKACEGQEPKILPLSYLGDEVLQTPTPLIEEFDSAANTYQPLTHLATLMELTRQHYKGVGLAAPQVGHSIRMALICCEGLKTVICNPSILNPVGQQEGMEGCLSIPTYTIKRKRAEQVTLRYQDVMGTWYNITVNGYLAVCIQHEVDHLDGKLFIDVYKRQVRRSAQRAVTKHLSLTTEH